MPALLDRYATPFITGLFLVSLISGVALFFHWGSAYFHGMHEWLSMVLIVPFVLHIWKNWRPITIYLKRAPLWIALAVSTVAAAAFVLPGMGAGEGAGPGGRPAAFALSNMVMAGSVAEVAAVLDVTPEALSQALTAQGYSVASPDQSLEAIAGASGRSVMDVAGVLVSLH
jgi:hypothetical protein